MKAPSTVAKPLFLLPSAISFAIAPPTIMPVIVPICSFGPGLLGSSEFELTLLALTSSADMPINNANVARVRKRMTRNFESDTFIALYIY